MRSQRTGFKLVGISHPVDDFAAGGGFVGAHYFVHRWKGHGIPDSPELRRQSLQRLMSDGRIETYAVDGKTAIRAASGVVLDEDETVEMKLSDAMEKMRLHAAGENL